MAHNEATLPLLLYLKVNLNHWACNGENIMSHFYTLFYYFFGQCSSAIPTLFFMFNVFSTCSCPFFSKHRLGCTCRCPKSIMLLNFSACCISSNPYCIPSSCTQCYGPSLNEQCLWPEQLLKDLWDALFTKIFSREDIPASSLDCQLYLFLCQWYCVILYSVSRHTILVTQ